MKLDKEKISSTGYFRIGYDIISGNYLLETDDTMGNNRYFVLTPKQYMWFETQPDKLYNLYILQVMVAVPKKTMWNILQLMMKWWL